MYVETIVVEMFNTIAHNLVFQEYTNDGQIIQGRTKKVFVYCLSNDAVIQSKTLERNKLKILIKLNQ